MVSNFLLKNLNPDDWTVYSANPDPEIPNRVAITLKAVKDNVILDEKTGRGVTVKKNAYVRGLVEAATSCVRVVLYIEPDATDDGAASAASTYSLKNVKLVKGMRVLHSYIPDKQKAVKLQQVENKMVRAKKVLTDALPYEPGIGVEYTKHVSDPDFKERWNARV